MRKYQVLPASVLEESFAKKLEKDDAVEMATELALSRPGEAYVVISIVGRYRTGVVVDKAETAPRKRRVGTADNVLRDPVPAPDSSDPV